jgi:hypothetical protein
MTSIVLVSARVGAHCALMLGGLLTAAACGGGEPTAPPDVGSGAGHAAGGMSQGGTGGSGVIPEGGESSGTGGMLAGGGLGSGGMGSAGGAAAASGTSAGGGVGELGGRSGATGAGTGGMTAGTAGYPSGAPSIGGAGAGGAISNAGSGSRALSFEADIWPVFEMTRDPVFVYYDDSTYESCVTVGVCHGGQAPGARLFMRDAESAYEMLFDVPSRTDLCDGTIRVVAGDPDQSCLVRFYEVRLRDELGWVDTGEIDLVREWITQGALP